MDETQQVMYLKIIDTVQSYISEHLPNRALLRLCCGGDLDQPISKVDLEGYLNSLIFPARRFKLLKYPKNRADDPQTPLRLDRIYGIGGYALVLKMIDARGREFAVRIGRFLPEEMEGLRVHSKLARLHLAPRLYSFTLNESVKSLEPRAFALGITIMEPIYDIWCNVVPHIRNDRRAVEMVSRAFRCLLNKKFAAKFLHGDMHCGNIVLLSDGRTLGFIDFQFSILDVNPTLNILDFIPLIESIHQLGKSFPHAPAIPKLVQDLLNYYRDSWNVKLSLNRFGALKGGGYKYRGYNNIDLTSYISRPDKYMSPEQVETALPGIKAPRLISSNSANP